MWRSARNAGSNNTVITVRPVPASLMGPLSMLPPKPSLSQSGGAQWASQWQFFLLLHTCIKTVSWSFTSLMVPSCPRDVHLVHLLPNNPFYQHRNVRASTCAKSHNLQMIHPGEFFSTRFEFRRIPQPLDRGEGGVRGLLQLQWSNTTGREAKCLLCLHAVDTPNNTDGVQRHSGAPGEV